MVLCFYPKYVICVCLLLQDLLQSCSCVRGGGWDPQRNPVL
jgi:hypothetical protein